MIEEQLRQNRYTEEEKQTIKSLFGGENGIKNLKILRKVFFPQYDYDLPIGQQQVDMGWYGLEMLAQMAPQDRELAILSQVRLSNHIEKQLQTLMVLANQKEENEEERKKKLEKDSVK